MGENRSRREFLRLAAYGSLGIAAACRGGPSAPGTPAPTHPTAPPASTKPPAGERALAWRRVAAAGPSARRDHTLTADESGAVVYLFGGRANGVLGDLWSFENGDWTRLSKEGPPKRFSHNAAFVGGRLLVFGGQDGSTLFNDLWAFDPARKRWDALTPSGDKPRIRYGAGGDRVGESLVITHGFRFGSRYDDTWSFDSHWSDVSPSGGPRPIKRCLHRAVALPGAPALLLFGGQTDGTPFLGDTWVYDAESEAWTEMKGDAPSRRNLYAAAGTGEHVYLYGGKGPGGALDDLWRFDGSRWKRVEAKGDGPGERSGIEAAAVAGPSMLVFGGSDGSSDLDDLWELTLPA